MRANAAERKRSFDLLRIILILMVCTLHTCGRLDALFTEGAVPDAARYAGMALECLSIAAVNTWVIMSGYLLVEKEFKLERFLELLATVLFYAAFGFVIVFLLAKSNAPFGETFQTALRQVTDGGVFACIQALFPISAEYYWFMTCYLLLYILTPLINKGARALTRKQYRTMLVLFLIWTSVIKSMIPVNFVTDDGGYGIKWFICLYLTGAYFKLEEIGFRRDTDPEAVQTKAYGKNVPNQSAVTDKAVTLVNDETVLSNVTTVRNRVYRMLPFEIYIAGTLLIYMISLILYRVNLSSGRFAYFMTVPLHYNFVLTLIGACGLFLCFKNMKIKNRNVIKISSLISPHTLGVYLLHAHPLLFYTWPVLTATFLGPAPRENAGLFVLYVLETVFILFVCGVTVDLIRSSIFHLIRKAYKRNR